MTDLKTITEKEILNCAYDHLLEKCLEKEKKLNEFPCNPIFQNEVTKLNNQLREIRSYIWKKNIDSK